MKEEKENHMCNDFGVYFVVIIYVTDMRIHVLDHYT